MDNQELEKTKKIIKIIDQLSPYMPPVLKNTHFMWFNDNILYMTVNDELTVYQTRLSSILKEECNFIKEVKFLLRSDSNEYNK